MFIMWNTINCSSQHTHINRYVGRLFNIYKGSVLSTAEVLCSRFWQRRFYFVGELAVLPVWTSLDAAPCVSASAAAGCSPSTHCCALHDSRDKKTWHQQLQRSLFARKKCLCLSFVRVLCHSSVCAVTPETKKKKKLDVAERCGGE